VLGTDADGKPLAYDFYLREHRPDRHLQAAGKDWFWNIYKELKPAA
jgi:oligosaccharide 4-alpha-D-glucosyltransferase